MVIPLVAQRMYSKKRLEQSRQLQILEALTLAEHNAAEKLIFKLQLEAILEKKAYAVWEGLQTDREIKFAKVQMERKARERRKRETDEKTKRKGPFL